MIIQVTLRDRARGTGCCEFALAVVLVVNAMIVPSHLAGSYVHGVILTDTVKLSGDDRRILKRVLVVDRRLFHVL